MTVGHGLVKLYRLGLGFNGSAACHSDVQKERALRLKRRESINGRVRAPRGMAGRRPLACMHGSEASQRWRSAAAFWDGCISAGVTDRAARGTRMFIGFPGLESIAMI